MSKTTRRPKTADRTASRAARAGQHEAFNAHAADLDARYGAADWWASKTPACRAAHQAQVAQVAA